MSVIEERLRPVWEQWCGVIPVWAARKAGIRADNLRRWANGNDDVDHVERGIYAWYPDDVDDADTDWNMMVPATAVALGGEHAYLWGPSVLEAARLGTIGGSAICVAVPKRRRKRNGISWVVTDRKADSTVRGIPAQSLRDAVYSSAGEIDEDKYAEALTDALSQGIITETEYADLKRKYCTYA